MSLNLELSNPLRIAVNEKSLKALGHPIHTTWIPKQIQPVAQSPNQVDSHEASCSSYNQTLDVEAPTLHIPTIVNIHENPKISTPLPVQFSSINMPLINPWENLNVSIGVAKTYWAKSPHIPNWNNWFQQVTTSFKKA